MQDRRECSAAIVLAGGGLAGGKRRAASKRAIASGRPASGRRAKRKAAMRALGGHGVRPPTQVGSRGKKQQQQQQADEMHRSKKHSGAEGGRGRVAVGGRRQAAQVATSSAAWTDGPLHTTDRTRRMDTPDAALKNLPHARQKPTARKPTA